MIYLLIASVTVNVCAVLAIRGLLDSRHRSYEYAVNRANDLPVGDPVGHAYSDMATVIVLR